MTEPVNNPVVTHLLVKELLAKSQIPKPTAMGTPFRYSSAFACGRQQGYMAFDAEPTEPMDEAGAWLTGLGTIIHEALQEAISRTYADAEFELGTGTEYVSGSCDALIPFTELGGTHILYELKTMGTYSFDKQVGWKRMRGEWNYPDGPAAKAIAQAGMNALGIEASRPGVVIETVVMGSITFEALSKQKADKMGVEGYHRVLAEFHIPRSQWEPIALAELARIEGLHFAITSGYIPERVALDDNGIVLQLDPKGNAWQCAYCAFRSLCEEDGGGQVWINQSNLVRRNQD